MKVSRVELEDGNVVSVEHPDDWNEERIKAFARLNGPASKRTEQISGTDNADDDDITTTDLVKLALSRFAVEFIPDVFLMSREERSQEREDYRKLVLEPQAEERRKKGLKWYSLSDSFSLGPEAQAARDKYYAKYPQGGAKIEKQARQMAGIPQDAELTFSDEIIAGLADPLSLAGTPLRAGITPFVKAAFPAALSTMAGTTAGITAPQVAREMGAGPLAQELTGIVAGGLAGAATGAVAGQATTGTAFKVARDVKKKVFGDTETFGPASEALANSKVRAEINRIKNTTSPAEITKAVENLASLKEEIPNLEIGGIVATMADNPVARSWIKKTAQNNKAFQKEVIQKLLRDAEKLSDRFDVLIGEQRVIPRAEVESIVRRNFDLQEAALRNKVEKQTANIDKALDTLAVKLTGKRDEFEVGRTANALLQRKENQVRSAANTLYDSVKSLGKNVKLTEDMVTNVYKEFQGVRFADIFGPTSKTAKQLETKWSPKEEKDAEGNTTYSMPEVSGNDIVSLKKALNTELNGLMRVRDRSGEQQQRIERLYQLKEIVKNTVDEIGTLSPEFVSSLRKADEFYYKELGLPMRAEGMREFSAKNFDRGAAQTLMDYEKAKDYVNFVGPQGLAVVRHAIRLKAEKSGVVDAAGQINQNKLDQFIRRNDRLINFAKMAPEFSDISGRLRTIRNTAARHNQAHKEKARDLSQGFFKAITNNNLSTVVTEMRNNPAKRKSYLEEINKLNGPEKEIVLNGLRQEFLGQGLSAKGSMQEYVNSNVETVSDIFGPKYVTNINKIAQTKDLMSQVNDTMLDSLGSSAVVDTVQDITGVSIGEFAGTFRNQILSTERKFINLAMKSVVSKGKDKFYTKSAEVLLDPNVVDKLANPPKEGIAEFLRESKAGAGDYIKSVGTYYTDALKGSVNMATLRAINSEMRVSPEETVEEE